MSNKNLNTETAIDLNAEIELLKAKIKELKSQTKTEKVKKGVPVRFTNKAGETIEGNGVLYYVVNINKKLHYKEASQVELLETK